MRTAGYLLFFVALVTVTCGVWITANGNFVGVSVMVIAGPMAVVAGVMTR